MTTLIADEDFVAPSNMEAEYLNDAAIQREYTAGEALKYAIPSIAMAAVQTPLESLGIAEEGDAVKWMSSLIGNEGAAYYAQSGEAYRTATDLVTAFIPGMAAVKGLKMASTALHASKLATNPLVKALTLAPGETAAMRTVYREALGLAQKGTRNPLTAVVMGDNGKSMAFGSLQNRAIGQAVLDGMKQNLAFELGVLATHHSSETLYPSDWDLSDHLMFNAVGLGAGAFIDGAIARRVTKQAIGVNSQFNYGEEVAKFYKSNEKPLDEIRFRKNDRSAGMTIYGLYTSELNQRLGDITDVTARANMQAEITKGQSVIGSQLTALADDGLSGLLPKHKLHDGQAAHYTKLVTRDDPLMFSGVTAISEVPYTIGKRDELLVALDQRKADVAEKFSAAANEKAALVEAGEEVPEELEARLLKHQADAENLRGMQYTVLEPTGVEVPLTEHTPKVTDGVFGQLKIEKPKVARAETPLLKVELPAQPGIDGDKAITLGMTIDGIGIFPTVLRDNVNIGANTRKIISSADEAPTKQLLIDLAEDWHVDKDAVTLDGRTVPGRGKKILQELPPVIQQAVSAWKNSSSEAITPIRKWFREGTPEAIALYEAYAPFRQRLHELADADGTITLYRGQAKTETAKPTHDVVSMSSDWNTANRGFGAAAGPGTRDTIAVRVPVDDIIMPIGGAGNEWEFIVKGHLTRDQIAPADRLTWNKLSTAKKSAYFSVISKAADEFIAQDAKKAFPAVLHSGDHWTRFEWAVEVMEKSPQAAQRIQLPKGWTWDDLQMTWLDGKFQDWQEWHKLQTTLPDALKAKLPNRQALLYELNLPVVPGGEASPIEQIFLATMAQGDTSLKGAFRSFQDMKLMMLGEAMFPDSKAVRDTLQLATNHTGPLPATPSVLPAVSSPLVDFMQKPATWRGNATKVDPNQRSLLLARKPVVRAHLNETNVFIEPVIRQHTKLEKLSQAANQGLFVGMLADDYLNSTFLQPAKNLDELIQGRQYGHNIFTQSVYQNRDIGTIQALDMLTTYGDKQAVGYMNKLFSPGEADFAALRGNSIAAKTAQTELSLFVNARRFGWDLANELAEVKPGYFGFKLSDTKDNRTLWKQLFDEDMPKDAMMPAGIGANNRTPVAVSGLAHNVVQHIHRITEDLYANTNALRNAMGLTNMNHKAYWVPPKRFDGQHVAYLVYPAEVGNKPIKRMLTGSTAGELEKKINSPAVQQAIAKGDARIISQSEMETYFDLHDHAFFDLLDMTDPLNLTAKATGASASPVLEWGPDVLDDMVRSISKQINSLNRRTRAIIFEPQIRRARELSAQAFGRMGTDDIAKNEAGIWQTYVSRIQGAGALNKNTTVGSLYAKIEDRFDDAWSMARRKVDGLRESIGIERLSKPMTDAEFAQVTARMEGYMPFKDAVDFAENAFKISPPQNLRQAMAANNFLITTAILRFADVAHAILNMGGVMANTPGVIHALKRVPGENEAAWRARIGAIGTAVGSQQMAMLNPTKVFARATHDMFTPAGRKVLDEADKLGYLEHEAAEIAKTLTEPLEGQTMRGLKKLLEKSKLTWASDKSEKAARAWAHMAGYQIATEHLGLVSKDAHMWAHRLSNSVIGDYRSVNRPQVFQGTVGMPLGLFQTYVWNLYQRMFTYIENRQYRSLAIQYAMQGSLFGAASLPGWNQLVSLYESAQDGVVNPVDGLRRQYGEDAADLVMYGALSNLPKLFADDGISLFTRAGTDVFGRAPTFINPGNAPLAQVANSVFSALGETVDMFKEGGQYSNQRMLEILGTWSVNRPLKGVFEMAAGVSVDKRGQLVSDDTLTGLSVVARTLGLKPILEQKLSETYYRNRAYEVQQREAKSRLRESLQSMARDGFDGTDMADAFRSYYEAGGNPSNFREFLRDAIINANTMRTDKQFKEALASRDMNSVMRLFHASRPLGDYDPYEGE